jgi:hypothetical protein
MRAASGLLILGISALPFTRAASQRHSDRGYITVSEARKILGGDPATIPGYPATFYAQSPWSVLVHQTLDSSRADYIDFVEDRSGPPTWNSFHNALIRAQMPDRETREDPITRLQAYVDAQDGYRKVGEVSVHWISGPWTRRPPKEFLDKLAPLALP